ncbi:hypothetical protein ACV36Q_30620, partial [Pseudomonas aeruginosa]
MTPEVRESTIFIVIIPNLLRNPTLVTRREVERLNAGISQPSIRSCKGTTMSKTLKPGTPAPKSGQYKNPGTGNEVTG